MKTLLIAALLLTCSAAYAKKDLVGETDAGELYSVYTDTIKSSGAVIEVWVEENTPNPPPTETTPKIMSKWQIKCAAKTSRVDFIGTYLRNGKLKDSFRTPESPYEDAGYNTIAYSVIQHVCKHR